MTVKEAKQKGILKDKIVHLRLIAKPNALTNDPSHVAYGGFDGSRREYTIGQDKFGRLVDPFVDDEEREFFESITKRNLSVYTPENEYWDKFSYTIIKDPQLIKVGILFDLSDPNQMLNYKVLLTNKNTFCPSMDEYKKNPLPFFEYVFVDSDYEEVKASIEMDENKKIYSFFGKIEDSPTKMRDFLNVYYSNYMKNAVAPISMSKEALHRELDKIIREDKKGYLAIVDDKNYEIKIFINKAVEAGAILKEGLATYSISGEPTQFSYAELVDFLNKIKADKEVLYHKIEAQIRK